MLYKRENTPVVPREKGRKNEPTSLDISVERPEMIMDKIHMTSVLISQNWMAKHIGM